MTIETLVPLLAFLFPLAYSPGPGNLFFASLGGARGLSAIVAALAGYHVATFVVTAAIGMGLSLTVLGNPTAVFLGALGSAYVFWLAIQFFRSARDQTRQDHQVTVREPGFVAGAVVLLFNPKAYYIIGLLFTQFLTPGSERHLEQVLAITAIFTLNNLMAFVIWAIAGAGLTRIFASRTARQRIAYGFAVSLTAVAVWMALPLIL